MEGLTFNCEKRKTILIRNYCYYIKTNSTKSLQKCFSDLLCQEKVEFGFVWENLVIKSERKKAETEEE